MDNMPSLADIVAVTDGKTDGFNGGFWIFALIILFAMMGGGFGGWNRQGEFGQYATAASQQEILFGQHFGQINDRLTNIGNGICDSTFALNNAITTEGRNLSNQLANCCCEQRLGIANLSAQMNQNTCDIARERPAVRPALGGEAAGAVFGPSVHVARYEDRHQFALSRLYAASSRSTCLSPVWLTHHGHLTRPHGSPTPENHARSSSRLTGAQALASTPTS